MTDETSPMTQTPEEFFINVNMTDKELVDLASHELSEGTSVAMSDGEIDRLIALARIGAAVQPTALRADAGYVRVPKEPTEAMIVAMAAAVRDFFSEDGPYPRTKAMYRAMISEATKP